MQVLDESEGFRWLGSAATRPVSNAWRKLTLEVEVEAAIDAHVLDVSLFFAGAMREQGHARTKAAQRDSAVYCAYLWRARRCHALPLLLLSRLWPHARALRAGAGTYLLDDLELSCPERAATSLLNLTFETSDAVALSTYVAPPAGATVASAAASAAASTALSLEAPVAGAGFHSAHGATLRVLRPFAAASDAKLRLTKLTAVAGAVNVSLWVRLLGGDDSSGGGSSGGGGSSSGGAVVPADKKKKKSGASPNGRQLASSAAAAAGASDASAPFVKIDVLDETAGFEWLGSWLRFPLSSTEWRRVEALIHVPPSRTGHTLDTALVVGGAAPGVLIDDIVVTAPPIVGAGVPVKALSLTFDDEAAVKHVGVVSTGSGSGTETTLGGGPNVRVQLRSPHAALSGSAGAMFTVLSPVEAPASARLLVCHLICALPGALKVVFWARTPEKVPPHPHAHAHGITPPPAALHPPPLACHLSAHPPPPLLTLSWVRPSISHPRVAQHPAPRLSVDIFDVTDGWKVRKMRPARRTCTRGERVPPPARALPPHRTLPASCAYSTLSLALSIPLF